MHHTAQLAQRCRSTNTAQLLLSPWSRTPRCQPQAGVLPAHAARNRVLPATARAAGTTKADKRLRASGVERVEPVKTVADLAAENAAAAVSKVPLASGDGVLIVRYSPGKIDQKRDHSLSPPGKARNAFGGFFSS